MVTGLCEGAFSNDSFVILLQGFFWAPSKHKGPSHTHWLAKLLMCKFIQTSPFLSVFILTITNIKNVCLCIQAALFFHTQATIFLLMQSYSFSLASFATCLCWRPLPRPGQIYYCTIGGCVDNNQVWPMLLLPDSPEITGDKNTAMTQLLCLLNINFVFGPLPKQKFSSSFPRTVSFIWRWSESENKPL